MRVIALVLVVLATDLAAAEAAPYRPIDEPAPAVAAPFLRERGSSIADFAAALAADGEFTGAGTVGCAYRVRDAQALAAAAGEGVEPNTALTADPDYAAAKASGAFHGGDSRDWWRLDGGNARIACYAWAEAWEDPGLRGLHLGHALARAGDIQQAVKAWYAAMLLHPQAQQWSADGTSCWPVADLCWGAILDALDAHPELGVRLVGADVATAPKPGAKERLVAVTPGTFMPAPTPTPAAPTPPAGKAVAIARDAAGGFWLFVDGKPSVVRGVSWGPTPIGLVPWKDHPDAQRDDRDHDGAIDAERAWLDADGDGRRGDDEPQAGDFRILAAMGCNAVRIYADDWNLDLMRRMHRETGIRVLVGDFFGAYCVHSGADWDKGTDYADAGQRAKMLDAVRALVERVRGEPWVLGYVLGNENDLPGSYAGVNATRTNAAERPDEYAKALQEAAELIHRLDPDHPVGVGSVGLDIIDAYAKHAPALDFIGVNRYVDGGFGSTFARVKAVCDRPVLITEFGAQAYRDGHEDQAGPARALAANWRSLAANALGRGQANALGGFVFEYTDEWWKDTTSGDGADAHSVGHPASGEEWLGLCAIAPDDPLRRIPRRAFWVLQGLWRPR